MWEECRPTVPECGPSLGDSIGGDERPSGPEQDDLTGLSARMQHRNASASARASVTGC